MIEIQLNSSEKEKLLEILSAAKPDDTIKNIIYRLQRAHDVSWYESIKDAEQRGFDT